MQLRGKRFTVLGAGKSGLASVRLLLKKRAKVFLSDSGKKEKHLETIKELDELGVQYEFGENSHLALDADTIIVSPGVPLDAPILKLARTKNIFITGEIELASSVAEAPLIAITGTNGKTTTTALTGEIFKDAGWTTVIAGNIGTAFADVVENAIGEKAVCVLEVSSFQLDTIKEFRPKVAAILNITPDHLDRYKNYEAYIQSKFRIAENQRGHDIFVYNHDDEVVRSFAETVSVRAYGFSLNEQLKNGAFIENSELVVRIGRERESVIAIEKIGIPGPHNLMNAMAAVLMARAMGIEYDIIRTTLASFKGVEHRIEFVRELDGVKYYNDSKATNVDSMKYALQSFKEPIILIAGGKDKGNDYKPVKDLVKEHVKALVTVGDGAAKLEKFFKDIVPIHSADHSMPDAVALARKAASNGDIVLLSPACASFDMFDNYEHRGRVFKEIVMSLRGGL
ncbi:MAG TPA: UDP-N-acetylmuramoyl-L-alanine--D-glutamate ligase [Candidatus Kapabacteria bacterium]|nr:UDP-N-acetylmuramoyl-L-alanine--D-glutamate ligase [Candidatus Kapabacteria bacterium]